jgi:signal transduction histidine kinase
MWVLLTLSAAAAVVLSPSAQWEPIGLLLFLAALVIAADLFSLTLPGKGALTPMASGLVLAMMFLGALPAATLAFISSIIDGFRRGIGRPATVANAVCHVWLAVGLGVGIHHVTESVESFDAGSFVVGSMGYLAFSALSFVWLVWGWSTDRMGARFREQYVPLLPPELLVALFTGGAAELYSQGDDVALAVVAAAILVFGYVSRQLQLHEARARELEDLTSSQRALMGRLTEAEASHRRALAHELHDGPLQALLAARQDAAELAAHPDRASDLERTLAATITDLRETTLRLHPAPLRELGFERSVARFAESMADRHQLAVTLAIARVPDADFEELAYSALTELLVNVGKHAHARAVTVETGERAGVFSMSVTDDGRGFGPDDRTAALAHGHVGLASLRERVHDRGGAMDFQRQDPGVRVTVSWPIRT